MPYVLEHDGARYALYLDQTHDMITIEDKTEKGETWILIGSQSRDFWKQYMRGIHHYHIEKDWPIDDVIQLVLQGVNDEHVPS